MDLRSTVRLANGVEMPWVGLGVFQSKQGAETEQAVRWALEIGYRHIDTAAAYGNEEDVGKALRASGVSREEVFVTTKVWNADQGYEKTLAAFDASRRRLGLDVLDLYLVHWPVAGKYKETWRALEKLYKDSKVRAVGVSNYGAGAFQNQVQIEFSGKFAGAGQAAGLDLGHGSAHQTRHFSGMGR